LLTTFCYFMKKETIPSNWQFDQQDRSNHWI
jgi:hypothetical protein